MFNSLLSLFCGTCMLYFGAEWIVKGSSRIASKLGISSLVIGLTVVAFGTSLPELIVSIFSALEGSPSIAVGNVVGSNIANVGLVLGLSALFFPFIYVQYNDIKRDLYVYLFSCGLFIFFAFDGRISQFEGIIFVTCLLFYILYCIKSPLASDKNSEELTDRKMSKLIFLVISGIILLSIGAEIFVDGAIYLARYFGLSEVIIGMSVVAFGTSLPELSTSVMAAFKKESAISVGNIIGSNIFNILSVLGITSIIYPLDSPRNIMSKEVLFMVGFAFALFVIAKLPQPISRFTSIFLLTGYLIFIYMLF
jgi:cation:H+ antiporter